MLQTTQDLTALLATIGPNGPANLVATLELAQALINRQIIQGDNYTLTNWGTIDAAYLSMLIKALQPPNSPGAA